MHAAGLRLWPSEAKEIGFDEHVELVEHEHGSYRVTSVNIGQLCSKMFQDVPSLQRCHGGSRQVAVRLVEAQACKARRDLQ